MTQPPFVVDLHAHFPMQFDPEGQSYRGFKRRSHAREKLKDKIQFLILSIADRFFNRATPHSGHAVTIDTMLTGAVGVALSVAYCPFSELDMAPYPAAPEDGYFAELKSLLLRVEDAVEARAGEVTMVRSFAELEAARASGKLAIIHAVEGGFHVGATDAAITAHVSELAALGAGYITVAHLFYRQVATNAPALPFMPDWLYNTVFPRDPNVGLDPRGRTLVREMVRRGVLVDITHMSEKAIADTFALLDQLDPQKSVPVIASHQACSFGKYQYNLSERWVRALAERGGVCGILYCDHYIRDGRGEQTTTFDQSFEWIVGHVDKLRQWGSDDVLAIGSDLDGFIKPTLAGLESAANHRDLAARLEAHYGPVLAEKICHTNALRVLERGWMKPVAV